MIFGAFSFVKVVAKEELDNFMFGLFTGTNFEALAQHNADFRAGY